MAEWGRVKKVEWGGDAAADRDGIPSMEHFVRYKDITEGSITIRCCTQTYITARRYR